MQFRTKVLAIILTCPVSSSFHAPQPGGFTTSLYSLSGQNGRGNPGSRRQNTYIEKPVEINLQLEPVKPKPGSAKNVDMNPQAKITRQNVNSSKSSQVKSTMQYNTPHSRTQNTISKPTKPTNNIVEKPVENHSLRMEFARPKPAPAKAIQIDLPEMHNVVDARKAKPTSFPKRQVPEQTNKYVSKPAANYQNAPPTTSSAVPPKPVSKTIAAFQRRAPQQVPDTTNQNMNRASIDQGQKVVSRSIAAFQKRPVYENEAASTNNIVEKPVENHSLRMEFARPKRTPAKAIQIDLPEMHNVVDARKAKSTSFPKRQVPEQTNKYVSKAVEINLQMEQTKPLPRPPKAIQIDFPEMYNTIDPREVQPTSSPKKIRPDPTSNQVPKPVEIKLQQKEQVKPLPMPPRAVNINLSEMHRCSNPRKAKSTSFPKRVKPDVTINQVSKPLEITLNMEQVKPLPRPPKAVEIRASMKNDVSITPRKIHEAGDVSNNCYQVAKPAENHNLRMDFPQASRQPKAVRIDTPINHNVVRTTKSNQIELPDRNLSQSIPQRKNIVPKPAENHNVKVDHRVPRAVKPVHINLDRKK